MFVPKEKIKGQLLQQLFPLGTEFFSTDIKLKSAYFNAFLMKRCQDEMNWAKMIYSD